MAKLRAGGRTVVAAMMNERATPESELCVREGTERRLMSDGVVLIKHVSVFKATQYSPELRYDYGWKNAGKLREGITAEQWVANWLAAGWERVTA